MTRREPITPAFRALLYLLPKHVRSEHEEELRQFLALETPDDRIGRIRYFFETLIDVLRASPGAHLDILRQDVSLAFRQLRRAPGYGFLAVLTLSVGIGGNAALFTVVDHTLLTAPPFLGADRLVSLGEEHFDRGLLRFGVSPANFRDFARASDDLIESATAWQRQSGTIQLGETSDRIAYAVVSGGFFQVFREAPELGRTIGIEDDVPGSTAVVVSHSFWVTRLGADESAIGRTIPINGTPHHVVGVMPEGFAYPSSSIVLWKPLGLPESEWSRRGARFLGATFRLRPEVEPALLAERVAAHANALEQQYPETNEGWSTSVITLQQAASLDVRTPLLIVWAAAGLILLIAVANVANLLLGRAVARQEEMALRRALGARSNRLIRQTLTEGGVLAVLGGTFGLGLAGLLLYQFRVSGADVLLRASDLSLDPRSIAFTISLTVLVTLMFSVVPAMIGRSGQSGATLKTRGSGRSIGRARLQTGLVIGEIALAVVVAVGTGLLARSAARLFDQPLGYIPEQVTTFRVEPPIRVDVNQPVPQIIEELAADRTRISASYSALLEQIRAIPDVIDAGAVSRLPLTGEWWITSVLFPQSPSPEESHAAHIRVVAPGYLAAMGTRVLEGRDLGPGDVAGAEIAVVIDETFAQRHWGRPDVVGEIFQVDGPPDQPRPSARVVGVVESVRQSSLEAESRPTFYVTIAQATEGHGSNWGMDIVLRSAGVAPTESMLREITRDFLPDAAVFRLMTMEDLVSASVADRRFQLVLFGGFATVALVLTLVGVFGILALFVRERTPEFGVRLALGATPSHVRWLVQRNALTCVAWGSAIGLVTAALTAGVFESLVYGISAYDPIAFAGGPIVLCLAALAGALVPAWNATRTDPATVLRGE